MAAEQGSGSAALLILSVLALVSCSALAKTVQVNWNQNTDYTTFATDNKVQNGDTLVFTFGSQHTAEQVSKADYDSCTSNPIKSLSSGVGHVINGDSYFICSTVGHCSSTGGMKLAITVSSTPTTPTTPGTPSTPSSPSTPTTPSNPAGTPGTPGKSAASALQAGTAVLVAASAAALLL